MSAWMCRTEVKADARCNPAQICNAQKAKSGRTAAAAGCFQHRAGMELIVQLCIESRRGEGGGRGGRGGPIIGH